MNLNNNFNAVKLNMGIPELKNIYFFVETERKYVCL